MDFVGSKGVLSGAWSLAMFTIIIKLEKIFSSTLSFKISVLMSRLSPLVGWGHCSSPRASQRQLSPFLTPTLTLSTAQRGTAAHTPSLLLLYFLPVSGLYKATPSSRVTRVYGPDTDSCALVQPAQNIPCTPRWLQYGQENS